MTTLHREDNPRLISRQDWWIAFGWWMTSHEVGPPCTECGEPMRDADLARGQVCVDCEPYVSESER